MNGLVNNAALAAADRDWETVAATLTEMDPTELGYLARAAERLGREARRELARRT